MTYFNGSGPFEDSAEFRTAIAEQAIGSISLINAVPEHGSVEMGWVYYSKHLKQPSRNTAVRLGFVPEGIFRNHMVYRGRSRDTEWLSITDAEWLQKSRLRGVVR